MHNENGEKYVCHGFQFAPRAAFGDCQLNATINQIYLFTPLVFQCVCVCESRGCHSCCERSPQKFKKHSQSAENVLIDALIEVP